jgi:Ig-like domain from next to BRCA1 gene
MKKIKLITVLLILGITLTGSLYSQSRGNGVTETYDNAAYLSQSTPGEMNPGQSYGVSVTMKNTGRSTWKQGNYSLKLMNITESAAKTWSINSVDVNSTVSPGNEVVFNFTVVAPVEGAYNIQWQMADGNAFFGEPSANVPVRVLGPTPPVVTDEISNNSQFVSQQVPADMEEGHTYDVVVIMKNSGTMTWNPGENRLKISTKGGDNTENWSVANVELSSPVYSGSNVTFSFKVTAPNKDGNYNFQSQVVKNDKFFGEPSTNVIVNVH